MILSILDDDERDVLMSKRRFISYLLAAGMLSLTACANPSGVFSGESAGSQVSDSLQTVEGSLSDENAVFFGRLTFAAKNVYMNWTNSGFEYRFKGTGTKIKLATAESDPINYPYVQVIVDKTDSRRVKINKTQVVTLCEGLEYGEHTVRVVKTTETSGCQLAASNVVLESDVKGKKPEFLKPDPLPERKIEFIGDSITTGYGNIGSPSNNSFITSEQDGLNTYGAYIAEYFNADARYIAAGGKGIVKDCVGNDMKKIDQLPQMFGYTSMNDKSKWDYSKWQADVVVINAGTNDQNGGVTSGEFEQGVLSFLQQVRKAYPNAYIFWCYGMMNSKLHDAAAAGVEAFNKDDGKACYVPLANINDSVGEKGSGGHPNKKAHRDRADILIEKIKSVTGWN